jgi:uncharacterized OB-fold protein
MSGRRVPVRAGLFDEPSPGVAQLFGTRCRSCGRYTFPRADQCPHCSSTDVEPVVLSDTGSVWGWTVVHTAPPGYEGPVPFGFGVVELPEGLRVITRLEVTDPAELDFGAPVRLTTAPLHENDDGDLVITYTFALA